MKLAMKTAEEAVQELEQILYLAEPGTRAAIEVLPGYREDGFEFGPVLVEIIILDYDGVILAYRLSRPYSLSRLSGDEEWQTGTPEDAVNAAICYRVLAKCQKSCERARGE